MPVKRDRPYAGFNFLVDLKGSGAKSTARVVNSLHRDGKLGRRIAEWRDERNLAAEAASRPKSGKRTTLEGDCLLHTKRLGKIN